MIVAPVLRGPESVRVVLKLEQQQQPTQTPFTADDKKLKRQFRSYGHVL